MSESPSPADPAEDDVSLLWKVVFEHASIGISVVNLDGHYIAVNPAYAQMLGYSNDELLAGLSIRDVTHPDDQNISRHLFRDVVEGRRSSYELEKRYVRKDGSLMVGVIHVSPLPSRKDAPPLLLGMLTDVTARKEAEQALRQSEKRYHALAQVSPVGIIRSTREGECVYVNNRFCEISGMGAKQCLGKGWIFAIHPEDRGAVLSELRRPLEDGDNFRLEYRYLHPDGKIHWVLGQAAPEKDGQGNIIGYVGTVTDISALKAAEDAIWRINEDLEERVRKRTLQLARLNEALQIEIAERRQAEEALRRNEEALRASSEKLSLAIDELEKSARLKDEFLASMSHELRTPLNAVLGLSEALLDQTYGPMADTQTGAVRRIAESGQHLLALINDILDLSKIEAGKLEIHPEVLSVESVCRASLRLVHEQARKKKLEVKLRVEPAVSVIWADQRRLTQILINLLSNAVKFTPDGGTVGLTVAGDADRHLLQFSVWDTGIGITREGLDLIFNPFVQLDSSLSRQHAGTGLGLSLVRKLSALHGGKVTVDSEPGRGSRFTVSLPWEVGPAGLLPAARTLELDKVEREGTAARRDRRRPRILLAEDNEANILTFSDYLQSCGHDVMVATTGLEAVEKARVWAPDLILMDIQLPGVDGIEAMRRIRAERANVPILALTAFVMPGDRERCLQAGARDYLAKPIGLKELLDIVEHHLASALSHAEQAQPA